MYLCTVYGICKFILLTRARPIDAHGARAHEWLVAAAHLTSAYCCLARQLGLLKAVPASPGRAVGGHGLAW